MAEILSPYLNTRTDWQRDVRQAYPLVSGESVQPPIGLPEAVHVMEFSPEALALTALDREIIDDAEAEAWGLGRQIEYPESFMKDHFHEGAAERPDHYLKIVDDENVLRQALISMMSAEEIKQRISTPDNSVEFDAQLRHSLPEFTARFMDGIAVGIEQGYLPHGLDKRVAETLDQTPIHVIDSDLLPGGAHGAYFNSHDRIIVSSKPSSGDSQATARVLAHELNHKKSGGTFTRADRGAARPRVGFSTELTEDRYTHTGWNEAVTEYESQAIMDQDFETIDPDSVKNSTDVYYGYRKVLAAVYDESGGHMSKKTLLHAFNEDTGPEGGFEYRKKFIREVVDCYGWGAVRKIEKLMEFCETMYYTESEADPKEAIARFIPSCIITPQVNEKGQVIRQGSIDVDSLEERYTIQKNQLASSAGQKFGSLGNDELFGADEQP